jgi:1,4-dihydroxy-2-naphthoate octaprenyltransferase
MGNRSDINFKSISMLLRVIAVVTSSVVTILSTWLPLVLGYNFSVPRLLLLLLLLVIGAFLIHGLLTHILNDITDYKSGTDQYSPALLSGGSRVIQSGTMSPQSLHKLGLILMAFLLGSAVLLMLFRQYELTSLIIIGMWGAVTYSNSPFRFSYIPFLGEWLSLFPSLLALGIAAPWIMMQSIPVWGWQNALINAVWCMAWVMVHHIPDINADKAATPVKRTSAVWASDYFKKGGERFPAILYLTIIIFLAGWILFSRPVGGAGAIIAAAYGIYLIMKVNVGAAEDVTAVEKKLLLLAAFTALWLGLFY